MIRAILTSGSMRSLRRNPDRSCATKPGHISCHRHRKLALRLRLNPRMIMSNRDIIVIGGSSGAINPLKDILERLPTDLPAAVFVVLHIPARGIGILSSVTAAAGLLKVHPAEDDLVIERGCVYLGVADHHLI